ncbi:hypothetical protein PC116_g20169 [Phytophthora cactorum]|uniref:Uncharacterized protein n=1 Tax=Phytophthora cactorum TaxID=29920 RepID=A0A8T1K713_9STRA|nr:hypothetical protein Pcac1_g15814 [Phytophthora cactorum]KAG2810781.1 hypothetical protein PC112_g15912 [Phytophthora cactorum]KAG2820285.1 hypothetical protein PC111_g11524 [Phytophthora cactorum]KAG2851272.1 hypothetical protein PC113_g16062 [Phytophthora cactorum]KAG2891716.1 hypothetical protein PC114_g16909 [Phytophthora cactorum]
MLNNHERTLLQVSTAIETILTKAVNKLQKFGTDKSSVLSSSITFVLPLELVQKAIKKVYDKTKIITLDDSSESSSSEDSTSKRVIPPYVRRSGLGNYTLKQLNAM